MVGRFVQDVRDSFVGSVSREREVPSPLLHLRDRCRNSPVRGTAPPEGRFLVTDRRE